MPDDLLHQLRSLEADYPGQPVVVQQADLREINRLRARLGLPPVDAHLREIGADATGPERTGAEPGPEAVPDHTEAREVYRAYLRRVEELAPHRAYADVVVRATAGRGQTPVRPLATLGTGGGPLLCDHCRKPMVLEGGLFHGVPADAAWARNPQDGWTSWVSGGMVVEVQTNGTLRIYHGYPGRDPAHCCNAARADDEARERSGAGRDPDRPRRLLAFIEHEFPALPRAEQFELLNQILNTLYSYDPGVGVNRPDGAG